MDFFEKIFNISQKVLPCMVCFLSTDSATRQVMVGLFGIGVNIFYSYIKRHQSWALVFHIKIKNDGKRKVSPVLQVLIGR